MEVKENISIIIFLAQFSCCDLPKEAIWIEVLALSVMRMKDDQVS